jgi:uncharacterized protein
MRVLRRFVMKGLERLWDLFCIVSIVGIWPRFIEPRCLVTKKVNLSLNKGHRDLDGLKILYFSDLHFERRISGKFLSKIIRRVEELDPDLIFFVGDFICYRGFEDRQRLQDFFCSLSARYGCYAVYGNHDYVKHNNNRQGCSIFVKVLQSLFLPHKIKRQKNKVYPHKGLEDALKNIAIRVLDNKTENITIKNTTLNITGLGDYWSGDCSPENAFQGYKHEYPGIVLVHNPDAVIELEKFPGDVVLCGHTHGGQVNFPFFKTRFTPLKNKQFRQGLFSLKDKKMFVTKGVGGIPFRWCNMPELVLITLEIANEN